MISHGALGEVRDLGGESDGVLRGVERAYSTASFPSAPYTREYDAVLSLQALAPFTTPQSGLSGLSDVVLVRRARPPGGCRTPA